MNVLNILTGLLYPIPTVGAMSELIFFILTMAPVSSVSSVTSLQA
jgi:hypothetical protein